MVYVDFRLKENAQSPVKGLQQRISIDDSSKVTVRNIKVVDTIDCGDEDCTKMVTIVSGCDVYIDASESDLFENIIDITMVRYNYYQPCYDIDAESCEKEILADGTIVYHCK